MPNYTYNGLTHSGIATVAQHHPQHHNHRCCHLYHVSPSNVKSLHKKRAGTLWLVHLKGETYCKCEQGLGGVFPQAGTCFGG